MKIKDAIHWIDIVRMGYICDPNECVFEKDGDPCRAFHCDEIHDALVMAMDALKIADRLEQIEPKKPSDEWFLCEFDSAYSIGFVEGYNTALADIRGDTE